MWKCLVMRYLFHCQLGFWSCLCWGSEGYHGDNRTHTSDWVFLSLPGKWYVSMYVCMCTCIYRQIGAAGQVHFSIKKREEK